MRPPCPRRWGVPLSAGNDTDQAQQAVGPTGHPPAEDSEGLPPARCRRVGHGVEYGDEGEHLEAEGVVVVGVVTVHLEKPSQ